MNGYVATGNPNGRPRDTFQFRPRAPWEDQALCAEADPELFFPDKGGSSRAAKTICKQCPVRLHCLETSLANDELFGTWGGLTERERRPLRRDRRAS